MIQCRRYFAHSREEDPSRDSWQELEDHLTKVGARSSRFAASFGGARWGHAAGLWHDLGKYKDEFQRRLEGEQISVEHSGIGAALAVGHDKVKGWPLAFVIAGHHSGLTDFEDLKRRVRNNQSELAKLIETIPRTLREPLDFDLPERLKVDSMTDRSEQRTRLREAEFWIRFLFSALVDADWLDTEIFLDEARGDLRGGYPALVTLRDRLDTYIDGKIEGLSPAERSSRVNVARRDVLEACRRSALLEPGLFSLTVPTGGGKTLSAMSFALRHAVKHEKRRVIVVIPYTSIIEQNAAEYEEALGVDVVVQHHSNLDPEKQRETKGRELTRRHELAAENWDAPVIVTTTVQFFESLFANRKSRCRKLHNICQSVVILDEVQSLPPQFLLAILDALRELKSNYGCSVVLSTATPPALAQRERLPQGLTGIREIGSDPAALARDLKRVTYRWPELDGEAMEWEDLAEEMAGRERALAVVHRREDARVLARKVSELTGERVFHLSALMCASHRTAVLKEIKRIIRETDEPCRLVSTQLIEAGVDIDFPTVYRALGGLDSVVQAAGRCNREGLLEMGRTIVFKAPTKPPCGTPQRGYEVTLSLLREAGGELDPSDPAVFEKYFRMLYMGENLDKRGIQAEREQLNFRSVGERFKLIEDGFAEPVIVPYGDYAKGVEQIRWAGPSKEAFRKLQAYTVNIYDNAFRRLERAGAIDRVCEGVKVVTELYRHLYDEDYGLVVGDNPLADPEGTVI